MTMGEIKDDYAKAMEKPMPSVPGAAVKALANINSGARDM